MANEQKELAHYWWLWVIRGLVLILLGIFAFVQPFNTIRLLTVLFGILAMLSGIITLIVGLLSIKKTKDWWKMVLEGLLGILVGFVVFSWPAMSLITLIYIAGAWALIVGILQIAVAIDIRKEVEGEWLLALAGILAILFGLLIFMYPGVGAFTLIILIGFYAVTAGIIQLVLGFKLRELK